MKAFECPAASGSVALIGTPISSHTEIEACLAGKVLYTWNPDTRDRDDFSAVFVFGGSDPCGIHEKTIAGWIGHAHLRVVCGADGNAERTALLRELGVLLSEEECERKFLVTYPDTAALAASPFAADAQIVQTYLLSEAGVTERVRMRTSGDRVIYTHTEKRRIDRQTSEEKEQIIGREAYLSCLHRADPGRNPVEKTRWCILYRGKYFELDVYPFWSDRAVVELELSVREEREIDFPPVFRVIREVTDDIRYKNACLAREIPYDPID